MAVIVDCKEFFRRFVVPVEKYSLVQDSEVSSLVFRQPFSRGGNHL
jgi:hypothetical protein